MTTRRKELQARMAADARMTSTGMLCPQPPSLWGAMPWQERIRRQALMSPSELQTYSERVRELQSGMKSAQT